MRGKKKVQTGAIMRNGEDRSARSSADGKYAINTVYSNCEVVVRLEGRRLLYRNTEDMRAVAVYLK